MVRRKVRTEVVLVKVEMNARVVMVTGKSDVTDHGATEGRFDKAAPQENSALE